MKKRNLQIVSVMLAIVLCVAGLPRMAAQGEFEVPAAEPAGDAGLSGELSEMTGEGEPTEAEEAGEAPALVAAGEEGYPSNDNTEDGEGFLLPDGVGDDGFLDAGNEDAHDSPDEGDQGLDGTMPDGGTPSEDDDAMDGDDAEEDPYGAGAGEEVLYDDMPPAELSGETAGGISVTASYGEGVFPEGTRMDLADIPKEEAIAEAGRALEDVVDAAGVDISFYNEEGEELQPDVDGTVSVSLSLNHSLSGKGNLAIVHADDAGNVNELSSSDIEELSIDGAEFSASSFSAYTIAVSQGSGVLGIDVNGTEVTVTVPSTCTSLFNLTSRIDEAQDEISHEDITSLTITGDTSNVIYMNRLLCNLHGGTGCSSLTSLNMSGIDTSNVTDMGHMFEGCSSLTSVDLSGFNTSNVTNMEYMFGNCSSLTELDLSSFDTSNVTSMVFMFYGCSSLTSLDLSGFNTSKVTIMGRMFDGCSNLQELNVSNFDTANVTGGMVGVFQGCSSLTGLDVSSFNTSNETNMSWMFSGCGSLTELDVSNFDTSSVDYMTGLFSGCTGLTELDLSNFDTSNVRHIEDMFSGCSSLTRLDLSSFDLTKLEVDYNILGLDDMMPAQELTEIQTPRNLSLTVPLTADYYDADNPGKTYDHLPTVSEAGEDTSLTLVPTQPVYVTGISLDKTTLGMYAGNEEALIATVEPSDATNKRVSWNTSNEAVATVDSQGKVTAVSVGTATITAATGSRRYTAECEVTVGTPTVPVTGVTLNKSTLSMTTGTTDATLMATVIPEDATNQTVSWASSDMGVVTVDGAGMLLAVSAGTATVTVTTEDGGHTAACAVTVTDEIVDVTGITVSPSTLSLNKGGSGILTATVTPTNATDRNVTWASSDMGVATVDQAGTVTAVKAGTATVTATTADGGYSDACEVTVTGYSVEIVDNRTSPDADRITAGIRNMNGDRYLVIEDSDGSTLRGLIASDSSLSYTSAYFCDISLTDSKENGNAVTDFGSCLIRMPVPEGMSVPGGTVRVVSVSDGELDKGIRCQPVTIDGADYVQFSTTHFSPFAFLYTAGNSNASPTVVTNTVYRYISGSPSGGSGTVYVYRGSSSSDDDDDDDDEDETEETGPKVTKVVWQESEKSTFYWKYGEKADGYRVQWSTSPEFKKSKTKTVTSGKKSKAVKGMKVGKKYYVRVRAYEKSGKEKVMGEWGHRVIVKRKR